MTKKNKGAITVTAIKSKDRKSHGHIYPGEVEQGARADITPSVSIRLYGEQYAGTSYARTYDRTFRIGDVAECDSYNLSYTGTIVSITAKTVTIRPELDSHTPKRLSLHEFNWRNRHFDADEAARKNADTLMRI